MSPSASFMQSYQALERIMAAKTFFSCRRVKRRSFPVFRPEELRSCHPCVWLLPLTVLFSESCINPHVVFLHWFSAGCTVEAHCVEAGSMSIFWTQNRALKTTSLARVLIRTWWDLSSLRWDPKLGSVGPGGSQLFSA